MNGSIPATEAANAATRGLDLMDVGELVAVLAREQRAAVDAVERATPAIATAISGIVERLRAGGRLHYFGAGSSGRIATLDASECPPTFGVDRTLVTAHVAGGAPALLHAVEGAEDDAAAGSAEATAEVTRADAVVGLSAGGGAPYVIAALATARALGALTIAVTSVEHSAAASAAERVIFVDTGSEPIAGSTRLKAGTAQKLVLNTISTATMIRLGRVHDNLMVDVVATNAKLHARAIRLVRTLADVTDTRAAELLDLSSGSVKTAVVMQHRGVACERARELLAASNGFLRPLL